SSNVEQWKRLRSMLSIFPLVAKPRRSTVQRTKLFHRTLRAASAISAGVAPLAQPAATMLPALIPDRASTGIWFSHKTFKTPTCAMPRANPPPSASPTLGGTDAGRILQLSLLRAGVE